MKKSRLYRGGAAFLAALVMFTGMPQGQLYVSAEESGILTETDDPAKDAGEPATSEQDAAGGAQTEQEEPEEEKKDDDGQTPPESGQPAPQPVTPTEPAPEDDASVEAPEYAAPVDMPEETSAAPQADPVQASYQITGPTKTTYLKGETLDTAGITITNTATTPSQSIPITGATISFNSGTAGVVPMTVSYDGKTETFNILVLDSPRLSAEYGQTLSELALPSDANGSWSWVDETQRLVQAGKQKYRVKFQPGSTSYQARELDAEVTVTCDLGPNATVDLSRQAQRGYTYDGTAKEPTGTTVTVGGATLREKIDYTISYADNVNAGIASVIVTGMGSYKGEAKATFPIAKAKLTIRAESMTIYCGDTAPVQSDYKYAISGLAATDKLEKEPDFACDVPAVTDAVGTYPIHPSGAKLPDGVKNNYEEITYMDGVLTVSVYVPQEVIITGLPSELNTTYNKENWPHGGKASVRFASGGGSATGVTAKPQYTGMDCEGNAYNNTTAPTKAGDYELNYTLEETGGGNRKKYALKEGAGTFRFTIRQAAVTITAPSAKVEAGEDVPKKDTLAKDIKVTGILTGDSQADVLDGTLSITFSEADISAAKAGTYDIIPGGVEAKDKNYRLVFVNGTLTVTGRQEFDADFTSIKAKDKTYDSKPHSISGYATDEGNGAFLYTIQVTDETRKKEAEKNPVPDPNPDGGADTQDAGDQPDYVRRVENVPVTDIIQRYQEIAPVDVGQYTLEIFAEVDQNKYEYDGDPLLKTVFCVTMLQKREMQLVGLTGMTNKDYDGKPLDLSSYIKNARLMTDSGVDITGEVKLKFAIVGTTAHSTDGKPDYSEEIDVADPSVGMPSQAGEYELRVDLEEQPPRNYVKNQWKFPLVIRQKKVTVTVSDQEMHIGDDSLQAGSALPESFPSQYQTEGILTKDQVAFTENLAVAPTEDVPGDRTGVYELVLSGLDETKWPDYEITWTGAKLTVKGQLHRIEEELKAVTNIPNGTSLEEIAKRLPKSTKIYLYNGGKAPGKDEDLKPDIESTAQIVWDTSKTAPGTSYHINNKTPQTFKMLGTVTLPELVYADAGISLTVSVSVSVREAFAGQAFKPEADVKSGPVALGTKVRLSTKEEGADIIYTIMADNPSDSVSNRLYKEPIEIRSTTTIRAIARIAGKRDSEELRITYYLDKTLNPGGDDPDDPNGPDPDVPAEDIPKDENGKPLKIPQGLWITDVNGYTYTGKAIKPEVRVYDYKTRLEEKKDYTISYKNNTNAADKLSAKAPTITVTGKGNYEGKLTKTFTIAPKNIGDADVKADDLTVAYNKRAQKPAPVVTWNGKKLAGNRDYSFDTTPQTDAAVYRIKLAGQGNYTGVREISFSIIDGGVLVSKLSVGKIAAETYTGAAITPKPVVKSGKDVLSEGKDYTLSYEDNVEVGTASVIITGAKDSRFKGMKRVTFAIKEAALMNKAKAELRFAAPTIYTGKAITASDYLVTVTVKKNGVNETLNLVKDKDYKVTYQNNVKVGTATAVFEGIGAYRGTLKKTFKISAYDLVLDPHKKLSIQVQESYPYMKGGSTQKPVVKFDGKTLSEGTDYTLSYKNHNAAGSYAVVTVKGKGSFTGSVQKGYAVAIQDISKVTVSPADKAYQPKANIYKTTVRVLDSNGKALSAGKDYDKNFAYTYVRNTKVKDMATGQDVLRRTGDAVGATDLIPALTEIRVTVHAAGSNYQGSADGTYRIGRASIANAKVSVPQQTYTGKAVKPKESEITVVLNGMVLSPQDYKITSYSNNVNSGTAKLTIQGQGENYGGTKTVTFKIRKKSLIAQIIG